MSINVPPIRENINEKPPTTIWSRWFTQVYDLCKRFQRGDLYRDAKYYSSDIAITINPQIYFNLIDTTAGDVTITMPSPSGKLSIGRTVLIKRNTSGANSLTINNIERGNNVNLTTQDFYLELYSNGADWWIISERR